MNQILQAAILSAILIAIVFFLTYSRTFLKKWSRITTRHRRIQRIMDRNGVAFR